MTTTPATTWRRRTVYRPRPRAGAPSQLARTAVGAHRNQLYTVYRLRWDSGREVIGAHMRGLSNSAQDDQDTLLDLATGAEITITSDDADVAARRLAVDELPPALLEVWPRDGAGRVIPPGFRERGPFVGRDQLRAIAQLGLDLLQPQLTLFDG